MKEGFSFAPTSSSSGSNSSFETPGLAVIIRFSIEKRWLSVEGMISLFFFMTVPFSFNDNFLSVVDIDSVLRMFYTLPLQVVVSSVGTVV